MPAPHQHRNDRTDHVSVGIMHQWGRLRTFLAFPGVSTGKQIKHKSLAKEFQGKHVTVEFDRPIALQIDGETVLSVTKYEVSIDPLLLAEKAQEEAAVL